MESPKSWSRKQLEKFAFSVGKSFGYKLIPLIHAIEVPTVVAEHESYYIYRNKERFEVIEGYPKYFIIQKQDGVKAIHCNQCLMISYSPDDIKHRYCHRCNSIHIPGSDEKKRAYLKMEEVLKYESLGMPWYKAIFYSKFPLFFYWRLNRKYKRYLFNPERMRQKRKRGLVDPEK